MRTPLAVDGQTQADTTYISARPIGEGKIYICIAYRKEEYRKRIARSLMC